MEDSIRKEVDIFNDLALLCSSPGYIHVIAFYCFKDSFISFGNELKSEDMAHMYSWERLVRTEISTLIGLMIKNDIEVELPSSEKMQDLIDKTDSLLKEIHKSMITESEITDHINRKDYNLFENGSALREPIFYCAESAYNFQYLEFAPQKYAKDNDWLIQNKGFSVDDAKTVIKSLNVIQNNKAKRSIKKLVKAPMHERTMLPAFIFSLDEIIEKTDLDEQVVYNVVQAFTLPSEKRNQEFKALNDFNLINAYPIIKLPDNSYLLFLQYSLVEAFYETPFYWFNNDKEYCDEAMRNRGDFTETFCKEKLCNVFGKKRVWSNVDIIGTKNKKAGEIDVLAVFADRAIIVQAKSKRLTIEARKGNDKVIKDDFKKSVQDSYNQALLCAELIRNMDYKLQDKELKILDINREFKEIYIFCVVSDSYPALHFQTRQFIKYEQTDIIMPPFIMDIFLLDVMAEMLNSPLKFLSYVNRRTLYFESIMANELTILSYHLQYNLWIENKMTSLYLGDDISADLDIAMFVRREGLPGNNTPEGILTKYKNTIFEKLINQIEDMENPATINFGFMLLTLGEDSVNQTNNAIRILAQRAKNDKKDHDATLIMDDNKTGLTIHCNYDPIQLGMFKLRYHCEIKKYSQKVDNWFGVNIDPSQLVIRFGIELANKWEWSEEMEEKVNTFPKIHIRNFNDSSFRKVGRNEPCPCGSGNKYKKCCGKNIP